MRRKRSGTHKSGLFPFTFWQVDTFSFASPVSCDWVFRNQKCFVPFFGTLSHPAFVFLCVRSAFVITSWSVKLTVCDSDSDALFELWHVHILIVTKMLMHFPMQQNPFLYSQTCTNSATKWHQSGTLPSQQPKIFKEETEKKFNWRNHTIANKFALYRMVWKEPEIEEIRTNDTNLKVDVCAL